MRNTGWVQDKTGLKVTVYLWQHDMEQNPSLLHSHSSNQAVANLQNPKGHFHILASFLIKLYFTIICQFFQCVSSGMVPSCFLIKLLGI
jgi:hypothetical protein